MQILKQKPVDFPTGMAMYWGVAAVLAVFIWLFFGPPSEWWQDIRAKPEALATFFVGFLGFTGVVAALLFNAWHERRARSITRARARDDLIVTIAAELHTIDEWTKERAKSIVKSYRVEVIKELRQYANPDLTEIYRSRLIDIGLLDSEEADLEDEMPSRLINFYAQYNNIRRLYSEVMKLDPEDIVEGNPENFREITVGILRQGFWAETLINDLGRLRHNDSLEDQVKIGEFQKMAAEYFDGLVAKREADKARKASGS